MLPQPNRVKWFITSRIIKLRGSSSQKIKEFDSKPYLANFFFFAAFLEVIVIVSMYLVKQIL